MMQVFSVSLMRTNAALRAALGVLSRVVCRRREVGQEIVKEGEVLATSPRRPLLTVQGGWKVPATPKMQDPPRKLLEKV